MLLFSLGVQPNNEVGVVEFGVVCPVTDQLNTCLFSVEFVVAVLYHSEFVRYSEKPTLGMLAHFPGKAE